MLVGTSMPWNIMLVTHSRCGSGFFSTPRMLALSSASFAGGVGLLVRMCSIGAGEEAAGAARGVEHRLAELRVDHVDDELGHGAGRVELAGVAGALQVPEDLLVDVAELVAVVDSLKSMSWLSLLMTCRINVPDFM